MILSLSGESGASGRTEGLILALLGPVSDDTLFLINYFLRKGAHVVGYAILGALNLRAIRGRRPGWRTLWGVAAVALALLVAVIDESRQATSSLRTAALADIGFDFCGAALGVLAYRAASE